MEGMTTRQQDLARWRRPAYGAPNGERQAKSRRRRRYDFVVDHRSLTDTTTWRNGTAWFSSAPDSVSSVHRLWCFVVCVCLQLSLPMGVSPLGTSTRTCLHSPLKFWVGTPMTVASKSRNCDLEWLKAAPFLAWEKKVVFKIKNTLKIIRGAWGSFWRSQDPVVG